MVDFIAKVTTQVNFYVDKDRVGEMEHPRNFTCVFEVPDFESAMSELKQLVKDVCKWMADDYALTIQSSHDFDIYVIGEIFGQKVYARETVNNAYIEKLKNQTPNKPKLNEESLKNDIDYGINMLRSTLSDKEWITNPNVVWQYYILQKHFGIPVPKELREQANNLAK